MPGLRERRPRLLAVGPALDQSSYARVMQSTLAALADRWDIHQLAVNHRGPAANLGWPILPNENPVDRYAVGQIPPLVDALAPDAVFVFNGFLSLPRYWELPTRLGKPRPLLVAQCPLLGEAVDPRLVGRLAFFDCVIVLSEQVRRHFAECLEHCRHIGFIDRAPRLEVVPHGIDTRLFHPLGERSCVRAGIPGLCDLPQNGFVVLNANRNEPRKRIDTTLQGFARFARDKPAGVRLYLHMGETREGNGLRTLIGELGIGDRVILASTETGGHPRLDDAALNRLYNACDVGLNTASSEGWGMISFEHAATGAAQIVPGPWVCGEIWRDHAELLPAAPGGQTSTRYTKETAVSADDVTGALERLYEDRAHCRAMAERAARLATTPSFQWDAIGARLDTLLSALCFPE